MIETLEKRPLLPKGQLNDCEMQHNAEVGLFTKPSKFIRF